jgi:hypothetical protein
MEESSFTVPNIVEAHATMVEFLTKPGSDILESLSPKRCNLWHAATGAASEGGEILDCVKKHVIYNKDLDRDHLIEELGDMEFFMGQLRNCISATREEVLTANYNKLAKKRYPNGYTDQAAQERADKSQLTDS